MSDSFADLWNSAAPANPSSPPQKLGSSLRPPTSTPYKPKHDVFSILASSSQPTSRPITPKSISPAGGAPRTNSYGGNDAFGDLLSDTLSSGSSSFALKNPASMTIAERAARAEQEKRQRLLGAVQIPNKSQQPVDSPWAGLDSLEAMKPVSTQSASGNASAKSPRRTPDSLLLHEGGGRDSPSGSVAPATQKSSSSTIIEHTILDLDEFEFSSPPIPSPHARPSVLEVVPERAHHLDRLLNDASEDDEDVLGALGKPVQVKSASYQQHRPRSDKHSPSSTPSRAMSPPPHVIGQIVEMGFSPEQARVALAATDSGLDVQGALDMLLANDVQSDTTYSTTPFAQRTSPDSAAETEQRSNSTTAAVHHSSTSSRRERHAPQPEGGNSGIQEQADRLLAQAGEIGMSVFSRANAFWSAGKEKVQKAYEERRVASTTGDLTNGRQHDVAERPRWMQDVTRTTRESDEIHNSDSNDDSTNRATDREPTPARSRVQAFQDAMNSDSSPDFANVYVPQSRRKRPKESRTLQETAVPSSTSITATSPVSLPAPLTIRKTVSASPAALTALAKYKSAGTEKFKLGQYADAESQYTQAISALPNNHLLLVPLFNNRALTRLKTGDYSQSIEDSTRVIDIIGAGYVPGREKPIEREEDGKGVDLGDSLVKARKRRAEAYEGKEKWSEASIDWEALAGSAWVNSKVRREAVSGAGRCRKMISSNDGRITSRDQQNSTRIQTMLNHSTTPLKTTRHQTSLDPPPNTIVLERFRKITAQAEAEDLARHNLKDSVDNKIQSWKAGKEGNIRALIASLDTVLWDELGWESVGMKDLVTNKQVKIRYTKAIARLHPDKLNTKNASLEHCMIANGVFGVLNDAWNAFQQ